jgi:hypothetical protein
MNEDDPIYSLTREELIEVALRDRQVKGQLAQRLGLLMAENCELVVLLNTRNGDIAPVEAPATEGAN